jgi:hypothetical protein
MWYGVWCCVQVAEELTARMDVYERLTVLSGLIIFSALSVFVAARNGAPAAEVKAFSTTNMLLSGCVIGANVYGTAVVLLQKVCERAGGCL